MKHILLVGGIALIAMTSCNSEGGSTAELKDQKDSLSYALGVLIGQNLQESELTDINYEVFLKGAKDHRDSTESMDLQAADEYVRTVL
jgi:hypothetical protein